MFRLDGKTASTPWAGKQPSLKLGHLEGHHCFETRQAACTRELTDQMWVYSLSAMQKVALMSYSRCLPGTAAAWRPCINGRLYKPQDFRACVGKSLLLVKSDSSTLFNQCSPEGCRREQATTITR